MPIVYRADKTAPVAVECEIIGYPNRDTGGNIMCDNTHFIAEADAWQRVLIEADAWVSLEARHVRHLRETLAAAEKDLVEAALSQREAMDNHREWQGKQVPDVPAECGND